MARKAFTHWPTVTLKPETLGTLTEAQAKRLGDEIEALVLRHVAPHARDDLNISRFTSTEIDVTVEGDYRCEHCSYTWTEASPDYNGGCCGKDEANNPQRLKDLQAIIDQVEAEDFYRYDEDRGRDRVKVDWPWALAAGVDKWLKDGRPADAIEGLMPLAKRVLSSDWCTLWQDPGPSGASLARLPDRVTRDLRPTQLAEELLSLVDDMDLLPARQGAA